MQRETPTLDGPALFFSAFELALPDGSGDAVVEHGREPCWFVIENHNEQQRREDDEHAVDELGAFVLTGRLHGVSSQRLVHGKSYAFPVWTIRPS